VPALFSRLFDGLLSIAAPPACMACKERSRTALCAGCAASLRTPEPRSVAGAPLRAAVSYAPPIDEVIHAFKYGSRPDLCRGLASLFPVELELRDCVLVPVPLHPRRLAERGYNQAALLATEIARRTSASVAARALVRTRDTPHQATLSREARLRNLGDAFVARSERALADRRVLLVDDVITTGATAAACVRALAAAGAEVAGVLAVASAESGSAAQKMANPSTRTNFLAHPLCDIGEKM
jgi:ComF family protein